MENEEIKKKFRKVRVVYFGHPDPKDDFVDEEYLDPETEDTITIDKMPSKEILTFAPFAGQGSTHWPRCPFCRKEVQCKEHYTGKVISRADFFRNAIWDITGGKSIDFRDGQMDVKYGIVWSGNLEYSAKPAESVKKILDELLHVALMELNLPNPIKEEIKEVYKKCISGKAFTYVFKNGRDSWSISEYQRLQSVK